jgi:hypothetical protein
MHLSTLSRNALVSVYFGAALMLASMAHDIGAPPLGVGLLGFAFLIVPMVRS